MCGFCFACGLGGVWVCVCVWGGGVSVWVVGCCECRHLCQSGGWGLRQVMNSGSKGGCAEWMNVCVDLGVLGEGLRRSVRWVSQ
jgi:hypothetical protein